jgi:nicotinamidase-related amidase
VKTFNGVQIATSLDELVTPGRAALVVYDMQVGVCRQIEDAGAVIAAVARALAAGRAAGMRVIFTRHMSLPKELMGAMAFRTAMAWQRKDTPEAVSPWFLRDSAGFGLIPELVPRPSEIILDKITMSAFEGTPLSIILRDCGVATVAFVGVALEIGIEPSVRQAADLGFTPIVIADACGWGSQTAADRTLAAMRFTGDAVITDVESFAGQLDVHRPALPD